MRGDEKGNDQDLLMEDLISAHQQAIRSFLHAILPGVGDVSDISQEVNLVLWKKRRDFRAGTNFKAWAFATARFVAMEAQRKYKRSSWLVFTEETLDSIEEDYSEAEDHSGAELAALALCVKTLRKEDLNLLRHRYISDQKLGSHSASTGRSVSALKVRLHKIRAILRRCIEQRINSKDT